jgi:DNA-binding GntR family transcriptional regulator
LNNEFHLTFYRASGRERLCTYINDLMNAVEPYIHLYLDLPGQLISAHTEHGPLLVAARNGDSALCEQITEAHLRRAAEVIVDMVDSNVLDNTSAILQKS